MTSDNSADLLPSGQTLDFNGMPLQVVQLIGSGATSEVYRGTLGVAADGRKVVIKAMKQLEFAGALGFFRGEGQTLSRLPESEQKVNKERGRGLPSDFHVAPTYFGSATYTDRRGRSVEYIVMDYMAGRQLPDLLAEAPDGRLPEAQALNLGFQLFHTLDVLHTQLQKSYIDLKFENLWWEETPHGGQLRLTDFGTLDDITPGNERAVRRDLVVAATYLCKMLTGYMPSHIAGELRGNQVPRIQRFEEISLGSRQLLSRLLHPNAAVRPQCAADVLDPGPPRAPDDPDLSGLVGLMNLADYWTRPVDSLVKIKDSAWARGTDAKGAARLTYLARARVVLDIWARRDPQADQAQVAQEREQIERLLEQSDNLANGIALFRAGSDSQAETFFSRGRGESYEPERIALFRRWSYAAGAARAPGVTLTEDDREGVERALELMSRRDWSAAQDQWRQLEPRLGRAKAFAYLQADLRLYSALGRAAQGDDPAATVSAYNDALAALDTLPLDEKEAIVRDETGRLLAERDRLNEVVRARQAGGRGAKAMAGARAAYNSGKSEQDEAIARQTFERAVDQAHQALADEEPTALPERLQELAALVDDALADGRYNVAANLAYAAFASGCESADLRRRWQQADELDLAKRDLDKGELSRFGARIDTIVRRGSGRSLPGPLLKAAIEKARHEADAELLRTLAGLSFMPAVHRNELNQEAQRIDDNWRADSERRLALQRERLRPGVDEALLETEVLLYTAGHAAPRPDFSAWSQEEYLHALDNPHATLQKASDRATETLARARTAGSRTDDAERLVKRAQNALLALERAQQQAKQAIHRNSTEAAQARDWLRQQADSLGPPAAGGDREAQMATAREVLLRSSWYLTVVDPNDQNVLECYGRAAARFDYLQPQGWEGLKGEADNHLQRFQEALATANEALARGETQLDDRPLTASLAPYAGTPEYSAFDTRFREALAWRNFSNTFTDRLATSYQPQALADLRRQLTPTLPIAFRLRSPAADWLDRTAAAAAAEAQQKMNVTRQPWSAVSSLRGGPSWPRSEPESGAPPATSYAAPDSARFSDRSTRVQSPAGGYGSYPTNGSRGPESFLPLIKWWFDADQTRRLAVASASSTPAEGWNEGDFLGAIAAAAVAGDAHELRRAVESAPIPPNLDHALAELTPELWRQTLSRHCELVPEPAPGPSREPSRRLQPAWMWSAIGGAVILILALLGLGYLYRDQLGLAIGFEETPTVTVWLSPTVDGGLSAQSTAIAPLQQTATAPGPVTPTIEVVVPTIIPTFTLTPTQTFTPTPAATAPPPEASIFYEADPTLVQPPPPVSDATLWLVGAAAEDVQPPLDGGLWLQATDEVTGDFLYIDDLSAPVSLTWRHDQPLAEGVYQIYALDTTLQSRGTQRFEVRLDDQPVEPFRGRSEVTFGYFDAGQTVAAWLPVGAYHVAMGQRLSVQVTADPGSESFAVPALLVARLNDRERALLEALPAPDLGRPLVALFDDDNAERYSFSGDPGQFLAGSTQWQARTATAADASQPAPPVWNGRYQVVELNPAAHVALRAEWLPIGRLPAGRYQLWAYVPAGSTAKVEYDVVADGAAVGSAITLDQAQHAGQWIDIGLWDLPAEAAVAVWATAQMAGNVEGATAGVDAVALLRVER